MLEAVTQLVLLYHTSLPAAFWRISSSNCQNSFRVHGFLEVSLDAIGHELDWLLQPTCDVSTEFGIAIALAIVDWCWCLCCKFYVTVTRMSSSPTGPFTRLHHGSWERGSR